MRRIASVCFLSFVSASLLLAATGQRWIHVRVTSHGVSGNASFNLPIEMASAAIPEIPSGHGRRGNFSVQASINGTDLRAVLDAVRNSPDNVFATMERGTKEVSVAKSGNYLLIRIAGKPSPEHHLGETVAIRVPIGVARSVLAENSNEIDVGAGIKAISRYGDVDVTFNNDKEIVRVWTDTRNNPDEASTAQQTQ